MLLSSLFKHVYFCMIIEQRVLINQYRVDRVDQYIIHTRLCSST